MKHLLFLFLFTPVLGCAEILHVSGAETFNPPEYFNNRVESLVRGQNKDDPRAYWLDRVRTLEGLAVSNDAELPLACLGSTPNSTYVTDGVPAAERLFDQDLRFYQLIATSHQQLVSHSPEMVALMQVADREFAHKDEYKELALRGIVAFERLLDHHRYLLAQAKSAGCLAEDAVNRYKFIEPARLAYLELIKGVKSSAETTGDLAGLTNASFRKYADPLSQRRAYAARLAMLTFLHKIYSESSTDAEDMCQKVLSGATATGVWVYACGYLFERVGRDHDAQRFYEKLKTLSSDNLDYLGKAKKRIAYIEDYNKPLGVRTPYQTRLIAVH